MAEIEGKKLICDVCGATVFLKYIGDGEIYGDYTYAKWRKYEKIPNGWSDHILLNSRLLCPSCAKRIKAAIELTVSKIREEGEQEP